MITVDLCAGPGGWDEAARTLGLDPLGVEMDDAACATRAARGHRTLQADICLLDPTRWAVRLLIASPPCQAFSMAGLGAGRSAMDAYRNAMGLMARGEPVDREWLDEQCGDSRAHVVLEPLRWALALRPEFIACEQVEPVLPLWEAMCEALRSVGYRTWCGVLSAECYGRVATCPVHDQRSAPSANGRLSLTSLATADPAGTGWVEWVGNAENAARRSTFSTDLAGVLGAVIGYGTTLTATGNLVDAWTVASLARAALDAACDATWSSLVQALLCSALPVRTTPRGRAAVTWLGTVTSGSPAVPIAPAESTPWSPRDFWTALCDTAKSYTTWMSTEPTTPPTICGCSSPTAHTCSITGAGISRAECSLCDDTAVPQTRRRAILMASLSSQPEPPARTHQRYVAPRVKAKQEDSLFAVPEPERIVLPEDRELLPWVSMSEALGWDAREAVGFPRRADTPSNRSSGSVEIDGVEYRERDFREASEPGFTVTEKARSVVRMRANARPNAAVRGADSPAPTITGGHDHGDRQWVVQTNNFSRKTRGPVRVTEQEAAVLQGFPADYPWQGTRTAKYRQIGDAMPPPLAHAVLAALLA